jgi:hypothetical protein
MPNLVDPIVMDQVWVETQESFSTSAGPNTIQFEGRKYTLPLGKRVTIPRGALHLWFGDPEVTNHPTDDSRSYRADQAKKLLQKWGGPLGAPYEAHFPKIKAWDWADNELPVITNDPEGATLASPDPADDKAEQMQAMLRQVNQQQQQLLQAMQQEGIEIPSALDPDTPDAPSPHNLSIVDDDGDDDSDDDEDEGPKAKPTVTDDEDDHMPSVPDPTSATAAKRKAPGAKTAAKGKPVTRA